MFFSHFLHMVNFRYQDEEQKESIRKFIDRYSLDRMAFSESMVICSFLGISESNSGGYCLTKQEIISRAFKIGQAYKALFALVNVEVEKNFSMNSVELAFQKLTESCLKTEDDNNYRLEFYDGCFLPDFWQECRLLAMQ